MTTPLGIKTAAEEAAALAALRELVAKRLAETPARDAPETDSLLPPDVPATPTMDANAHGAEQQPVRCYAAHNPETGIKAIYRLDGTPITQPRVVVPAGQLPAPTPLLRRALQLPPQGTPRVTRARRAWLAAQKAADEEGVPTGAELAARREHVGISQRDLAACAGLSRGLVAEVERGRRRHPVSRQRLAETLERLAAQPRALAPPGHPERERHAPMAVAERIARTQYLAARARGKP